MIKLNFIIYIDIISNKKKLHLILGDGETTAFRARHWLLGVEVAFLEVAGHQVQLDHSRASEAVVLASERRKEWDPIEFTSS